MATGDSAKMAMRMLQMSQKSRASFTSDEIKSVDTFERVIDARGALNKASGLVAQIVSARNARRLAGLSQR